MIKLVSDLTDGEDVGLNTTDRTRAPLPSPRSILPRRPLSLFFHMRVNALPTVELKMEKAET